MRFLYILFLFFLTCISHVQTEYLSISSKKNTDRSIKENKKAPKKIWTVHFRNIKNKIVALKVEVAQTKAEKSRGLMFRKKIDENSGMIFVYKKPIMMRFWMRYTSIPLSIAFINRKNIITDIYDMKPHSEKIISSTLPAIYAIEANKGWFKKNFIYPNSIIKIIKAAQ